MSRYLRLAIGLFIAVAQLMAWAGKPSTNKPPTVSLTSPVNGAVFTAPATISIIANAADSDGTVQKVDFYQGAILLASRTSAPYSFTWTGVLAGTYSLTAKATDNAGAVTTSAAVSISVTGSSLIVTSPANGSAVGNTVDITGQHSGDATTRVWIDNGQSTMLAWRESEPAANTFRLYGFPVYSGANTLNVTAVKADGTSEKTTLTLYGDGAPKIAILGPTVTTYNAPANIDFAVDAFSPSGAITKVEFVNNSTGAVLKSVAAAPYQFGWTNVPKGDYYIGIRAYNSLGQQGSTYVHVTVLGPNVPPTVSLTSPTNGASFAAPAAITLSASATDTDGSIAKVQFYQGGNLLGATNSPPYSFTLPNVAAGGYTYTAQATDNSGASTMSTPVSVTVSTPPTVSLTSPAANASFNATATVTLTAEAAGVDGSTVAKVEFFRDAILIGSAVTAPYTVSWPNVAAGSYQLTAKVTDSKGATAISAIVPVTVAPLATAVGATIVAPANNSSFVIPGPVVIAINAQSKSGTLTKLELYDGATLVTSVTPGASEATFNLTWYSSVPGGHTFTAKVTDSTGATLSSQAVTVQALTTPAVAIGAADSFFVAPATIDLYMTASTVTPGTTIAKVELFNGAALLATFNAPPYTFQWPNVAPGLYTLSAKATDSLGAVHSSAPFAVTVGSALSIVVDAGIDGSTVSDDRAQITGTLQAPANSAVNINGVLGVVTTEGRFFFNNYPLQPAVNTLTITVTDIDGHTASQTITVTGNGQAPFLFAADPSHGFAPLKTRFTLTDRGAANIKRIELGCIDGGAVSLTAETVAGISGSTCTYMTPGTYRAKITVIGQKPGEPEQVIYSSTQLLYVISVRAVDRMLRGVYTDMLGRLKAGNIALALNALTSGIKPKFTDLFYSLGENLPEAVDQLGTIIDGKISDEYAEYLLVRNDAVDGYTGYPVHLIRSDDGIWRIDEM